MSKEELIKENLFLKIELAKKEDQIAQLQRLIFGRKSERFIPTTPNTDQLNLFEEVPLPTLAASETEKEKITYERKKKQSDHKGRQLLSGCQHLPVEIEVINVNHTEEAVKIGENITELIAYKPGKLFRRQLVRPKYREPQSEKIICAELPAQAIPKCEADHSLISNILVSKFVDHLPEYRQQAIFKREGVIIPPSSMNNWTQECGNLITPVAYNIRSKILSSGYVQMDESTIRVMSGKKQGTHLGFMWCMNSPPENMVYFEYHPGRNKEVPNDILKSYSGILQTDAYNAYDSIVTMNSHIIHAGCMAHARRKFEQALNGPHSNIAESVLLMMQQLYAIESKCKDKNLNSEQRLQERSISAGILTELKKYLTQPGLSIPPTSKLYEAITYMTKRWEVFEMYTNYGIIEIDNNLIENSIRPLALGRKNYLFAGSHQAAQNIAAFYTVYGTCRKLEINPNDYTLWFLDNIPYTKINQIDKITPMAYKAFNDTKKM